MLTRQSKIPYAALNAVCMGIEPEPKIVASIGNKMGDWFRLFSVYQNKPVNSFNLHNEVIYTAKERGSDLH